MSMRDCSKCSEVKDMHEIGFRAMIEEIKTGITQIRAERDKMIRNLSIIGAIQMTIIFLQWVVIYIMIPAVR